MDDENPLEYIHTHKKNLLNKTKKKKFNFKTFYFINVNFGTTTTKVELTFRM